MFSIGEEVEPAMARISAEEKRWQAEQDARTLAEADVIRKTPSRLTAAVREAKVMATDAKKQAAAMGKVARITRSKTKKAVRRSKK